MGAMWEWTPEAARADKEVREDARAAAVMLRARAAELDQRAAWAPGSAPWFLAALCNDALIMAGLDVREISDRLRSRAREFPDSLR